ncbi:MAG: GNAT family N-acetyltransferase [Aquabacterium sp.]
MAAGKDDNYRIRVHEDPSSLDAATWNALLGQQANPTPFMRHEYLAALHASGSAVEETGWAPRFITVNQHGKLVAACPAYLKAHSYGEYVFDWAWADAYRRHGVKYYPKLLCAVPFTPVPGSRLLASSTHARAVLVQALDALMDQAQLSSAHLLFHDEADLDAAAGGLWMRRQAVQFHWQNRQPQPFADFPDFLAAMHRDKRKKIQQERRRVVDASIRFQILCGAQIETAHWDFFHRCYANTYAAHHSTPYLTRGFFDRMATTMAQNWVMFLALQAGQPVAASLVAIDTGTATAWGRYWGCIESVPCLHFEACYYQPLQWCIANQFRRFEGGAQGEHKMARGLMPTSTGSLHRLADDRFADAVADFLRREGRGLEAYVDELADRDPFKPTGAPAMP